MNALLKMSNQYHKMEKDFYNDEARIIHGSREVVRKFIQNPLYATKFVLEMMFWNTASRPWKRTCLALQEDSLS